MTQVTLLSTSITKKNSLECAGFSRNKFWHSATFLLQKKDVLRLWRNLIATTGPQLNHLFLTFLMLFRPRTFLDTEQRLNSSQRFYLFSGSTCNAWLRHVKEISVSLLPLFYFQPAARSFKEEKIFTTFDTLWFLFYNL